MLSLLTILPSPSCIIFFFFNDTATTEIYTLSLHDALPISRCRWTAACPRGCTTLPSRSTCARRTYPRSCSRRSEEHTSELQSRLHLVCRLLLEKKKKYKQISRQHMNKTYVSCTVR